MGTRAFKVPQQSGGCGGTRAFKVLPF